MIRNSVILLIVLIAVSGCDQTSENSSTKDSMQTEFVVLDKFGQEVDVFSVGEEITLELRAKNRESFALDYSFTLPGYSIEINQGDTPVWLANYGIAYAQVVTSASIEALGNKTITEKWNTVDNDGNQVSPGNYTITPGVKYFVNGEAIADPSPVDIVLN